MTDTVSSNNLTSLYGSTDTNVTLATPSDPALDSSIASKNFTTLYSGGGADPIPVTVVGNTTYNIASAATGGGGNLLLTGSDGSSDFVTFASGTGITVSSTDSSTILITNTSPGSAGVTSITGTANQVIASASTGAVTLSTPQNIATTSSPTFNSLTLTSPLAVSSGGTGRAVGNYSIYANEIHVGKDGNDTSGDGTLINPVLTITKALTLIGAGRNTVIVHPGNYAESPTVSSANTTIATSELTGANTQISGTLTLSAAARVSGIKLTNLTITGSGNTYISNCTVDTRVIKSGSNYVEIINSELQCTLGVQITGAGTVSIVGNKCWFLTVSNASASVLIKDCYQVLTPSVTAGTLQFDGSAIFAASPSSNAVTSSASSFITLANSFVLNSAGTNVERVSLSGFYSILNLVYDKPNSTLIATSGTGGNLNAIDYFSVVNADTIAGTSGLTLSTVGSNGNITLTPHGTGRVQVNSDIEATGNGNFNGTVIINNDQTVTTPAYQAYSGATLGSLTWNGTTWDATGGINSDGGDFGNITVGIATDNTISTTSGNLEIDSATNQVNIQALTYIDSDLIVNNGTVKTNSGNVVLFNTTATVVDAFGAATTINMGAATGTTIINNDLDVKGGDITNSTGALAITSGGTNTNITLTPNGTGDVVLSADTVQIGDLNTNAALTTNGTGDLVLNTNNGTNSGQITILNGASGNITVVPNGTGNVVNTFSNGGNLTNNRNYVLGAIRNATTASNGEVFTLGPSGTGFKGISLDNSADTADGPITIMRSFTGGAVAGALTRGRLVFERARGTSASPTAIQSGDQIGSIEGTGYTTTGYLADTLAVQPAVFNYTATENWVSNTNLGTQAQLLLAPTATTIATGANLVSVIAANPQTFACRSDAYTWSNGKTGTTQRMALDVSGNLTVSGDLTVTGNDIRNSGGSGVINMSTDNSTTNINTTLLSLSNPTTVTSYTSASNLLINAGNPAAAGFNDRVSQLRVQTATTSSSEASTITFNTGKYNTGTNVFSATASGDYLGEFFFSGNYGTTSSFTTLGPSVRFRATAAENFTATNSGGAFAINLDKIGGSTPYDAISIDSANASISSDIITLENNSGTDYAVLNSTSATFAQPVGLPVKTAAQWNAITGAAGRMVCVSNSAGGGNPNGMIAFWDTTNARWSYIHDNSAV